MIGRPAEALLGKLFIVDVLDRAVPADQGAIVSKPGRGPGAEPAIAPVSKAQTVLDIDRTAADHSIRPVLYCDGDIIRVQSRDPALPKRLLRRHSRQLAPARRHVEHIALWIGRPRDLRVKFNRIAVVLLTLAQGLF